MASRFLRLTIWIEGCVGKRWGVGEEVCDTAGHLNTSQAGGAGVLRRESH
jgi:hypothetical protein